MTEIVQDLDHFQLVNLNLRWLGFEWHFLISFLILDLIITVESCMLISWHMFWGDAMHSYVTDKEALLYAPRCDKTCLQGFWQSEFQTSLLSYRDYLENWNFTCSKFTYDIFQKANLIRLCGCSGWSAPVLFANPRRQVFSRQGPYHMALAST